MLPDGIHAAGIAMVSSIAASGNPAVGSLGDAPQLTPVRYATSVASAWSSERSDAVCADRSSHQRPVAMSATQWS